MTVQLWNSRTAMRSGRTWRVRLAEILFLTSVLYPPLMAHAQDFRIYTPVFDEAVEARSPRAGVPPQSPVVARCQSFFHANTAYDLLEPEGELIVFEPSASRFTIVKPQRAVATVIPFAELEQMVRTAETKAERFLLQAPTEEPRPAAKTLEWVEFQLRPTFRETYDRERKILTLSHRLMTYQVRCSETDQPESVQAFLKYCDWTARLNFVLHPQAPLPAARLTLNESLRKRGLMPIEVTLQADIGSGLKLRAEHQIQWSLEPFDRQRVHEWQQLVNSDDLKRLPFQEYHELLLATKSP